AGGPSRTPEFSDHNSVAADQRWTDVILFAVAAARACTVVIASADLLPALERRNATDNGEVLAFSDLEAHRALEEIVKRRPGVVELERQFAATPRGAALITRIRADPTL